MKKYIQLILTAALILSGLLSLATTYTWTGGTSTAWNTTSNWSPAGVPGSGDYVHIYSATFNPTLPGKKTLSGMTMHSGTLNCNGDTLVLNSGSSVFSGGTISNGRLELTGTQMTFGSTTFNVVINAVVSRIDLNAATFNNYCYFETITDVPGTGSGGAVFNDSVYLYHNYTGAGVWVMNNSTGHRFNGKVTIHNKGTKEITFAGAGINVFNGDMVLINTGAGGILLGNDTLTAGHTISIGSGGFSAGDFNATNFYQDGSTAISLTFTGSALPSITGATFGGDFSITSNSLLFKNCNFNGTASFTATGSGSSSWYGGNKFYGNATFTNNASAGNLRLDADTSNTYYADATFGGSRELRVCYGGDVSSFYGNITTANNTTFNAGTGTLCLAGSGTQLLSFHSNTLVKNLMLNKSGGSATLATALAVSGTVTFAKGTLTTTSSNLLTINNGGTVSGASDSSYIDGPVKKIGNSAFVFPTGKGNSCRAIGISAPSNTTDAFTGEYFAGALPNDPNARQSGIDYINGSNYWNLARNTGSSQVKVTLSWNRYSSVFDSSKVKLARWNGTQWSDLGTVALSGDRTVGSATNASNLNSFGNFTLGYTAFVFASCISGAIAPDYYYNFDANNFASSSPAIFSTTLSSSGTNTLVSNSGIPNTGYSLLSDNGTDLYVPNVLIDQTSEYFAVEMYVRFDGNFANRASAGFFRIQNGVHSASIDQTGISFSTDYSGITGSTAIPYESFFIPFDGINEKSFGYYTNDSWHYFCFVHKKIAAHHYQKQIWIDGKLNEGFSKDIINASITGLFINGTGMDLNLKTSSEHTNMGGYFDQVAIYLQNELCDKTIEQHGLNTTSLNVFTQNTSPYSPLTFTNAGQYDENDYPFGYAPGTGNYSEVKNVIEQLKAYPLPRYKSNRTLRRNFNWLGSNYLGEHDGTRPPLAQVFRLAPYYHSSSTKSISPLLPQ